MAECANAVSQQFAELNLLNAKAKYDNIEALNHQALIDNQTHARAMNQIDLSVGRWAETMKVFAATGLLQAGQTGFTENQQQVTPSAQATKSVAEGAVATADAAAATSNAAVAASIGQLATAAVSVITATGGVVTAQTLAAVLPILINAIGGASTPSQTQPKPGA